jgi:hypothetical protein
VRGELRIFQQMDDRVGQAPPNRQAGQGGR